MEPSLGSFDCSYGWCVRISPPYAYTGHMAGIAIEAQRIAANVAKLAELVRKD